MSAWALRAMIYVPLIKFNRATLKEAAQPHCLGVSGALRKAPKSVEMPTFQFLFLGRCCFVCFFSSGHPENVTVWGKAH